MKKLLALFIALLLLFSLAACEKPAKETTTESTAPTTTEDANANALPGELGELVAKMPPAIESLLNTAVSGTVKLDITTPDGEMPIEANVSFDPTDKSKALPVFLLDLTISMQGMSMDMPVFSDGEKMYMSMLGETQELSADTLGGLFGGFGVDSGMLEGAKAGVGNVDLGEQMETAAAEIGKIADELSVVKTGNQYTITAKNSPEALLTALGASAEELNGMVVNEAQVIIAFDDADALKSLSVVFDGGKPDAGNMKFNLAVEITATGDAVTVELPQVPQV